MAKKPKKKSMKEMIEERRRKMDEQSGFAPIEKPKPAPKKKGKGPTFE